MKKGHFFNEEQKQVKQRIMEKLMEAFFDPEHENFKAFKNDHQLFTDLVVSILVMFTRDMLINFFSSVPYSEKYQHEIMDNLFNHIKREVDSGLKEREFHKTLN